MATDQGLINAIQSLISVIKSNTGSAPGFVGGSNILDASGAPAGGKNINDILSGLSDNVEKLTDTMGKSNKAATDNKDALTNHLKGLENLGSVLA